MVIWAARMLGTGDYGIFSYALGLVSIFSVFADLGLSPLLTRELAKKIPEGRAYAASIIGTKFALLALSFLAVIVFAPFASDIPAANPLLPLVALLVTFDALRSFGNAIIRSENRMEREARLSFGTEIATAILGVLVLVFAPSVTNLVLAYLVGSGAGAIVMFMGLRNYFRGLFVSISRKHALVALRGALPYSAIGILGGLMTNIDIFFLGRFMDANAVGLYAAALRPVMLIYLLPTFLTIAVFPQMNTYVATGNNGALRSLVERGLIAACALAIPISIGGLVAGGSFVHNIFGAEYAGATLPFKILIMTVVPVFGNMILGHVLFSKDTRRAPIKASVTGLVVNVVLDLILIPRFGLAGSAIATLIAQISMSYIFYTETRKLMPLSVVGGLPSIVISSIVMGGAVYGLLHAGWNSLFVIASGVIVYISMLFLLRDKLLIEVLQTLKSSR